MSPEHTVLQDMESVGSLLCEGRQCGHRLADRMLRDAHLAAPLHLHDGPQRVLL